MTETEIIKEKKRNIYSSFFSEDYVSKFLFKSILHHVISLEIYENNRLNGISFETICANIPLSLIHISEPTRPERIGVARVWV